MSKIGLQLFSVWKDAEKDFLGTVQKVADLGYEGIQFAGFYNTSADKVKQLMDSNGIVTAGAHVGLDQLLNDKREETFEYHSIIENNLIICPAIPKEMRQTIDDYKRTAETLNQIGEACKKEGFIFGYHNHDFEFKRFGDKTGFDLLFENTDPELVKVELDCYWSSFANHDPLKIIRKYQNRVVSLHIKDMKIVDGNKKSGTEIGNGLLDFNSLIKVGNEYNVEWFTVEQEEFERDPYESLSINLTNLKEMMPKSEVK
ncbi:sugar phosphate isomerase/epimerase family protein [Pseudalkalibacillus decolorationis]|uniref:sugar phosphate isomerase/epimerase family protein n=1 Tax=Pseudalkalibacillus decolorationis TaxID=163879 RepID=UPI002147684E|nr:sugar phosphate isomerase/epimerase [Pseudalkalibacillus decolorationis]